MQIPTSITDADDYLSFCSRAATDDGTFAHFRTNKIYRRIVETVGRSDGVKNLLAALAIKPSYLRSIREFARNDDFGGPNRRSLGMSGTTLRYVRIAAQIESALGSLDGMRYAEIGVGYGGQARIIAARHRLASITLYDLPPALALASRYLGAFNLHPTAISAFEVAPAACDLVVSNYAFSEMSAAVQREYVDKVISRAAHGYFLFNYPMARNFVDCLSPEEFVSLLSRRVTLRPSRVGNDRRDGIMLVMW